jgi:hypothetical protein
VETTEELGYCVATTAMEKNTPSIGIEEKERRSQEKSPRIERCRGLL